MRLLRLFLPACVLVPLQAQSNATADEETVTLPTFTVSSDSASGYVATNSVSATKVAAKLKDLPVSLDVVTEQLFSDYATTELYSIVAMSAGVSSQRATSGEESYSVRGFTTFFTARNGNTKLRSNDSSNVARVEVVNGPTSVLYGQIDPGGVANTITKQPSSRTAGDLRIMAGSWDYFRVQAGVTGPLNAAGTLSYRVDASYLDRGGYRDYDDQRKQFVAPVLKWQPWKRTTLTVDLEYADTFIRGVSNWPRLIDRTNNVIKFVDFVPRTYNAQGPGMGRYIESRLTTVTLEQALTDRIVLRNQSGWSSSDRDAWEAGVGSISSINSTSTRISISGDRVSDDLFVNTTDLAARFDFGPHHYTRIVAGFEYSGSDNTSTDLNGNSIPGFVRPTWNLADPSTWNRDFPDRSLGVVTASNRTRYWMREYYLIDALSLFDGRFMLLGGARRSEVKNDTLNLLNGSRVVIDRSRTSPQGGAVWRVTPALGLYVNYSQSFRQITTLRRNQDRSLTPFDPLIADGLDAGVKYDFLDGRFSGQLTWFNIVYKNARQSIVGAVDSQGTYSYETQTGESESHGAEFRLAANVTRDLQIVAGYTYTDAEVTQNPADPSVVGRVLPRAPRHQASLVVDYKFRAPALKGWSAGTNIKYQSQALAFSTADPFYLDERIVVGARLSWKRRLKGKFISYNLSAENLFDEVYFPSSVTMADPTSFRCWVDYRF